MSEPSQDAFELVLLRPLQPDGEGLAHLMWSAPEQADRLVQVYVDGRLYDVTLQAAQRELWLHLDRAGDTRIELLAVEVADAWSDLSDQLTGWSPAFQTAASMAIVRDEALPVDSRVTVTVDGQADAGHRLWRGDDSRSGFGAHFGVGQFGHDNTTGPGHGLGEFATAPFGSGGAAWRWRRDDLTPGQHTLDLHVDDEREQRAAEIDAPVAITIAALPQPAGALTINNNFVLHWTEQEDD